MADNKKAGFFSEPRQFTYLDPLLRPKLSVTRKQQSTAVSYELRQRKEKRFTVLGRATAGTCTTITIGHQHHT